MDCVNHVIYTPDYEQKNHRIRESRTEDHNLIFRIIEDYPGMKG